MRKNLKAFWMLLLCALTVLACGIMLVACGGSEETGNTEQPAHTHSADATWHVDEAKGTHYHECTVCHERVDEAAHVEKDLPAVQATCQTAGKTAGKGCSVCGAILVAQQETQKTDHSLGDWQTDASKGTHYKECSFCHEHFDEAAHVAVSYEAVVGKTGYHQGVCECGFKMEEIACTPAAGWKNETKSGTTYHYQECSACNTKLGYAACSEFNYTQVSGDTANHQKVCTVCNNTTSEAHVSAQKTDAHDHWTACELCDYELTQKTAHTPTYIRANATGHYKQCSVCETKLAEDEYEAGTVIPHTANDQTVYTFNPDIRSADNYGIGGHQFTCADCGGRAEVGHGQKDWGEHGEWTPDPLNPTEKCQTTCKLCDTVIYTINHQVKDVIRDTGDGEHHQRVCIWCDSLAGELLDHYRNGLPAATVDSRPGYHAYFCNCGAQLAAVPCQSSRDAGHNDSSASWTKHSFECYICHQQVTNQPHIFVEEPFMNQNHDVEGNPTTKFMAGNIECIGCGFRPWYFTSDAEDPEGYYAQLVPLYDGTWRAEAGGYVLTVPDTYNGKPVTRFLGAPDLADNDGNLLDRMAMGRDVTKLILPESITELCEYNAEKNTAGGYYGIQGPGSKVAENDKEQAYMSKLETIVIKGNVKEIPDQYFAGAMNLKTLVLPASVERFVVVYGSAAVFHSTLWKVKGTVDIYYGGTAEQWQAVKDTDHDTQYMKLHYSNEWHWGDEEQTTPVLGPSSAPAALPALLLGKEW